MYGSMDESMNRSMACCWMVVQKCTPLEQHYQQICCLYTIDILKSFSDVYCQRHKGMFSQMMGGILGQKDKKTDRQVVRQANRQTNETNWKIKTERKKNDNL